MQVFALITFPIFIIAFIIAIGSSNALLSVGLVLLLYVSFKLARAIGQRGQTSNFQRDAWTLPAKTPNEAPPVLSERSKSFDAAPDAAKFSHPKQVIEDNRLSLAQKGIVLKEWEGDEQALARAANEGMLADSCSRSLLSGVKVAQAKLKDMAHQAARDRGRVSNLEDSPSS